MFELIELTENRCPRARGFCEEGAGLFRSSWDYIRRTPKQVSIMLRCSGEPRPYGWGRVPDTNPYVPTTLCERLA